MTSTSSELTYRTTTGSLSVEERSEELLRQLSYAIIFPKRSFLKMEAIKRAGIITLQTVLKP